MVIDNLTAELFEADLIEEDIAAVDVVIDSYINNVASLEDILWKQHELALEPCTNMLIIEEHIRSRILAAKQEEDEIEVLTKTISNRLHMNVSLWYITRLNSASPMLTQERSSIEREYSNYLAMIGIKEF